ncbi:glycerophosphodiester phosphodiesterase family protein [Pseudochelatococcus sp. G4_1912]|uniref:glycerophosphodiester phosphodiesterase family protein n=1 Tax=Pseudochelatococcus sp. G4_1912 TaxID=3114288 RepID=UPI0039C5C0DB
MRAPAWLTAQPIAHRGLHDARLGVIENTLTAGEAAAQAGFAIECDVQLSADGEAVVFHDFTLDRLTSGQGRVDALSVSALAALSYKNCDDRIIPLATYLHQIARRVPLIIEIKSRFDGDLRLARRVAEIANSWASHVALMSFDPNIIQALRELAPHLPRGIVAETSYEHGEWEILSAEQRSDFTHFTHIKHSQPDFLAWNVRDFPAATPTLVRHFGLPVLTWTVRTPDDRAQAAQFADQIIFEGFRP